MRVKPKAAEADDAHRRRARNVTRASLLLLLIFATATVFVREAWALQSFQIGAFALVAVCLLSDLLQPWEPVAAGFAPWLVYVVPLWGLGQIVLHTTASQFETREAVLRWAALAGVFFLSQVVASSRAAQGRFLSAFLAFATAMAALCVMQIFTSSGRVLWVFPTGYPDVYATFQNQNNYAQFVELALPVALWRALSERSQLWWYAIAAGLLYGSAIASASRAGAVICTAELGAMLGIRLIQLRNRRTGLLTRGTLGTLLLVPVLAAVFTFAVGWQHVWQRLETHDPFAGRREFLIAAIDMVKQRPLTGYGLGTFVAVYQQHAVKDFPFYANHAHNDWAEFASEGGVPFLLLLLIPFAAAIPRAIRHPWGLGIPAVMLHACVDYPFPRPAVSGWMFALLGMLYMTRPWQKNLHTRED